MIIDSKNYFASICISFKILNYQNIILIFKLTLEFQRFIVRTVIYYPSMRRIIKFENIFSSQRSSSLFAEALPELLL